MNAEGCGTKCGSLLTGLLSHVPEGTVKSTKLREAADRQRFKCLRFAVKLIWFFKVAINEISKGAEG